MKPHLYIPGNSHAGVPFSAVIKKAKDDAVFLKKKKQDKPVGGVEVSTAFNVTDGLFCFG